MSTPPGPTAQGGGAQAIAVNPLTGAFQIPLVMAAGAGAQASSFEVAPEELNAVKADLDAALEELKHAARDARDFRNVLPPGNDEVSINTTNQIIQHLTEGSGSATQTVDDMRRWVQEFRDKIDAAQRDYQRIDHENEIRKL